MIMKAFCFINHNRTWRLPVSQNVAVHHEAVTSGRAQIGSTKREISGEESPSFFQAINDEINASKYASIASMLKNNDIDNAAEILSSSVAAEYNIPVKPTNNDKDNRDT